LKGKGRVCKIPFLMSYKFGTKIGVMNATPCEWRAFFLGILATENTENAELM